MTKPDWSKAPEGATHAAVRNDGSLIAWLEANDLLASAMIERPTQWSGPEDGLPPVGTSVECYRYADPCVVMYASEQLVVLRSEFGEERSFNPEDVRPIKTQEQRELEQLQADINEAFETNATLSEFLHAKGYRKP